MTRIFKQPWVAWWPYSYSLVTHQYTGHHFTWQSDSLIIAATRMAAMLNSCNGGWRGSTTVLYKLANVNRIVCLSRLLSAKQPLRAGTSSQQLEMIIRLLDG